MVKKSDIFCCIQYSWCLSTSCTFTTYIAVAWTVEPTWGNHRCFAVEATTHAISDYESYEIMILTINYHDAHYKKSWYSPQITMKNSNSYRFPWFSLVPTSSRMLSCQILERPEVQRQMFLGNTWWFVWNSATWWFIPRIVFVGYNPGFFTHLPSVGWTTKYWLWDITVVNFRKCLYLPLILGYDPWRFPKFPKW